VVTSKATSGGHLKTGQRGEAWDKKCFTPTPPVEASLFSAPTLPWTMFEYMAVTKAGGCMDAANCIHGESGQRIHLRSAPNARFSTGKVSHTSSLVDQISGVREPQSPEESSVSGIHNLSRNHIHLREWTTIELLGANSSTILRARTTILNRFHRGLSPPTW